MSPVEFLNPRSTASYALMPGMISTDARLSRICLMCSSVPSDDPASMSTYSSSRWLLWSTDRVVSTMYGIAFNVVVTIEIRMGHDSEHRLMIGDGQDSVSAVLIESL